MSVFRKEIPVSGIVLHSIGKSAVVNAKSLVVGLELASMLVLDIYLEKMRLLPQKKED